MDGPGCQPERGPGSNHQCRQGRPRVPDDAVSSEVRHILRAAKTICTNARRRTVTSQCNDYCRLERLTSASSEAAVSTNSWSSGRLGTPPLPTCFGDFPMAATARNSCAARSIWAQIFSLSLVTDDLPGARHCRLANRPRKTSVYITT